MIFSVADRIAIEREACRRSLATFVREAWGVLEPGTPYVHGWHVDVICEHLEAVTRGDIRRLAIGIPPGTMKSTLTSVFWPAWEWGPAGMPHIRMIGASHEESLAIRDTRKMRQLITSDWYQARWPIKMAPDQSEKKFFENEARGFRQACAVRSLTGRRGHRIIWDDPLSASAANSQAERDEARLVFKETLPTRLVEPTTSAIVVVMQRLHEQDVIGEILSGDYGYDHLCLPMEFEVDRRCTTSIGWSDPRQEEGELLFPGRFPRDVVDRDKKAMGEYAVAGQFQQRPAPRTGGYFAWEKLEIVRAAPRLVQVVRYWDKAGTKDGGKRTAGVKIGKGVDGLFYVLDVVTGQWNAADREAVIRQTADVDGFDTTVWIEQEPGSGGKESAENTIANLAGHVIRAERPTGDKELRAEPYSVQVEAGNVRLVQGAWNQLFIDEHKTFPRGKFKDQIDAAAGGFNKLAATAPAGALVPMRYR
ncbi:Terminase-like family protein [compost metagenome]